MNHKKVLMVVATAIAMLVLMGSGANALFRNSSSSFQTRIWCCAHPDHARPTVSACVATQRTFSNYRACNDYRKSHNGANKGHFSACR